MKRLIQTNVLAGLFFLLTGVGFLYPALHYGLGSASRMGPGYFPALLSILLIGLGVVIAIVGLTKGDGDEPPLGHVGFGAIVTVVGSILLFAFVLPKLGLVISLVVLVIVGSIATGTALKWQIWLYAAVISAISAVLFVSLLGLPMPLWPRF